MTNSVNQKLQSLGYEVSANDNLAIQYAIQRAEQYVKHFCNISSIPECLNHVVIEMAVGDFMLSKLLLGQLSDVEIEPIVKKVQDGDATVEYAVTLDREQALKDYFHAMTIGHDSELIAHRKMRW